MDGPRQAYHYTKLIDGLWVGNANAAEEYFSSKTEDRPRDGIKSVISPAADCVATRKLVYNRWLSVLLMPYADHDAIRKEVADSILAFHKAHQPTFVHCAAGANRSMAVASIILCGNYGWSLRRAFDVAWPWCGGIRESVENWYKDCGYEAVNK
jgi:hypothetical protein